MSGYPPKLIPDLKVALKLDGVGVSPDTRRERMISCMRNSIQQIIAGAPFTSGMMLNETMTEPEGRKKEGKI